MLELGRETPRVGSFIQEPGQPGLDPSNFGYRDGITQENPGAFEAEMPDHMVSGYCREPK